MKTRPILFSGPMVRAILEGRKTMTRRIAKPEHFRGSVMPPDLALARPDSMTFCPYGTQGDRLWVRETWMSVFEVDTGFLGWAYRAGGMPQDDRSAGNYMDGTDRWSPSIHMPRAASRITLEITGVRVERLQEITHADAIAEGCQPHPNATTQSKCDDFKRLWESINGPASWDANPYVWAITFNRIEP